MQGSTVAILGVGAVAVGAGVYFLVIRPRMAAKGVAMGQSPADGAGPAPAVSVQPGQAIRISPSMLSDSHTERKNAVAPYVLSKFGVPDKFTQPIASLAGRLDVSAYAADKLKSVPVVGTAVAIPSKLIGKITSLF